MELYEASLALLTSLADVDQAALGQLLTEHRGGNPVIAFSTAGTRALVTFAAPNDEAAVEIGAGLGRAIRIRRARSNDIGGPSVLTEEPAVDPATLFVRQGERQVAQSGNYRCEGSRVRPCPQWFGAPDRVCRECAPTLHRLAERANEAFRQVARGPVVGVGGKR